MEQNPPTKVLEFKPFNLDISRIEQSPNTYNLNGRGDKSKDMVLLLVYGALFNSANFYARLATSFKQAGMETTESDLMGSHFVGWYKFPFMKLSFEKRAWGDGQLSETEGKATLEFGKAQDYTLVGVVAVPKLALRMGSELMASEGCNNNDFGAKGCHYSLMTNMQPLEPIQNDIRTTPSIFPQRGETNDIPNVIPEGGCMFFIATSWATNQSGTPLKPSKEYLSVIKAAHRRARKQGYQIPQSYLDWIESLESLETTETV